ncbi:MAG: hypothetical protein Q9191_001507 [Dirinaria sp. TL-2023a]
MRCTILDVLVFLLSTHAVSATPLQLLEPRAGTALAGYIYSGCYTEATNQRALTGKSYFDDAMTVEKCAAACVAYSRFGVEYGRECYCGDSLNSGSVMAPESDCSFPCPGNATETCGAGNRLDVYRKTDAPGDLTYTAKGCYTDDPNNRALAATSSVNDAMTVEVCSATCEAYAYFGVEYFRECYCGNVLSSSSVPAPAAQCDSPCGGNKAEACGGNSRLDLYMYNNGTY